MDAEGAPDPALTESAALDIVRRHFPAAGKLEAIDESGRKGRAYFIEGGIVLKTQRPVRLRSRAIEEFATSLEKEAFFLQCLAQNDAIAVPGCLGYGRQGPLEYICMTRIPGISLRSAELSEPERKAVLVELGALLRRIHSLPQDQMAASGLFPQDGNAAALRRRLESLFAQILNEMSQLPEHWQIREANTIAKTALDALPDTPERITLHSNPAPEHVFIDPITKRLAGLIDFGDAYISHPSFDLRPWPNLPDRDALLAGYRQDSPVDESFLATGRIGLILGELAGALRRREPPARAEANLQTLLAELH